MSRLLKIGVSTLLSGGLLSHGSLGGYVADAARRSMGIGLAHFQDGAVHYLGKDVHLFKRGLIQTAHQLAYGLLRSYPRYLKYWEQTVRDKYITTKSQTSIANKTGQYYQLISGQQAKAKKKTATDTIVGRGVQDYLRLKIDPVGSYYNSAEKKIESNLFYGLIDWFDLQPRITVSSKKNVVLTTVQGRDYTRKELVSAGDYEITIEGKITSKYPDVYPEAEVLKFLRLMHYKGVLQCEQTILDLYKIENLIILSYSLIPSECRNIQPYTISCVAVEPSEAIERKYVQQERVDKAIKHTNKWIKWVKLGADVVDPSSLLKISRLWI
nr:MAG TPA: hypothetical protein [Herelleviridae sp.]